MSAQIKRFIVPAAYRTHPVKMLADGFTATVVLHTDHLAAIAAERAQQAQRIAELEGLLRHAQKQVPTGSGLHMRIDTALIAGKEGE